MIQANRQFNLTRWLFFTLYISKVIKSYKWAKREAIGVGWEKSAIHWQRLFLNKQQPRAPRALSVEGAELPHCSSLFVLQSRAAEWYGQIKQGSLQNHFDPSGAFLPPKSSGAEISINESYNSILTYSAQCSARGFCPELTLRFAWRSRAGWRPVEKKEGKKPSNISPFWVKISTASCISFYRNWNIAGITVRCSPQQQQSGYRIQNPKK